MILKTIKTKSTRSVSLFDFPIQESEWKKFSSRNRSSQMLSLPLNMNATLSELPNDQ